MENKIITWILIFLAFSARAQNRGNFNLFTDRDIYSSGEMVLLKVFASDGEPSGIVHLDLFNLAGSKVAAINLEIAGYQSDGFIYLSDSLSSGSYILRASARTLKINTYKEIFIANRFANIAELNPNIRQNKALPNIESHDQTIEVKGIENSFQTRTKVQCMVNIPSELLERVDGDLLISIAEESLNYSAKTFLAETTSQEKHLNEKEGMILEGVVSDSETGLPFRNAVVYLSIPDTIPAFNYYLTGRDGRFYFQLKKYFGKIPIVLQCFDRENQRLLKITLIDPEKSMDSLLPFDEQVFLPEFQRIVQKNRDAVTYRKIFGQQEISIQTASQPKVEAYPFFGVPTHVVDPKLFTDLPDFSEISRELLPGVKFRTYNRIPTIQVINSAMHSFSVEPPLVLLDGIPVRDLNLIKSLGTKELDKVEICLSERFFGKLSFQGVVSIHTSKPDFSRITESNELIKLNLDAIQNKAILVSPAGKPSNEPDFRQVLLWEPNVRPLQMIRVNFQTSDIRGSFKMIIRGKTRENTIFYKEQSFEVR